MFPHIGGDLLFLLADAVRDGSQVTTLLNGLDLRFQRLNQAPQKGFALLPRLGIHIPGVLFTVRPHRRVAALPEMVADLADTAGARFAARAKIGLEGGHGSLLLRLRG